MTRADENLGTAAILLAAGASSRMGRAKQLLRVGDSSLVRRAEGAAHEAGCRPLVAVLGSASDSIRQELRQSQIVMNEQWALGIGGSIRAGLRALLAAEPDTRAVVLIVCDQPHLSAEIIRRLIAVREQGGKSMSACAYAGTIGTPCCFGRSQFDSLLQLADDEGAKKLLMGAADDVAKVEWAAGAVDLDTAEDWRRFCQNPPNPPQSPA